MKENELKRISQMLNSEDPEMQELGKELLNNSTELSGREQVYLFEHVDFKKLLRYYPNFFNSLSLGQTKEIYG